MGRVDALSRQKLIACLRAVVEALYPDGDLDHEWSPDTLDEIAAALDTYGLRPDRVCGDCPKCDGKGMTGLPLRRCKNCGGSGQVEVGD